MGSLKWISVKDKSKKPKVDKAYLIYGDQLLSHFPGKDVAGWDESEKQWYQWSDHNYIFREEEVDFYISLENIPNPPNLSKEDQKENANTVLHAFECECERCKDDWNRVQDQVHLKKMEK